MKYSTCLQGMLHPLRLTNWQFCREKSSDEDGEDLGVLSWSDLTKMTSILESESNVHSFPFDMIENKISIIGYKLSTVLLDPHSNISSIREISRYGL